jgi:FkbM family methyltransferase
MKRFIKPIALLFLNALERSFDFYTSPILPIGERLSMLMGRYEIGTTRFMKKHLDGGVALDIGANVGYYARLMAKRASHVYAFEPDPNNFALLLKNTWRHKNITAVNMAVSNILGETNFFRVTHSAMRHSLIDEGGTEKITVQCTSLDEFAAQQGISGISMIKIDVEGAEPLVFEGMQKTLESNRPIVVYEGFEPDASAIGPNGELVPASQAPLIGSKRKVVNLVQWPK